MALEVLLLAKVQVGSPLGTGWLDPHVFQPDPVTAMWQGSGLG